MIQFVNHLKDAIKNNSFYPSNPDPVSKGDVKKGLAEAAHVFEGSFEIGIDFLFSLWTFFQDLSIIFTWKHKQSCVYLKKIMELN